MSKPVLTSRSSNIGNHRIVEELGPIEVVGEYETVFFIFYGESEFDSEAEVISALKDKAREKGANGIINMKTWHWGNRGASGLAVKIEEK